MAAPAFSDPVLLYGDSYLCKDHILAAKKKYSSARWKTFNASKDSVDEIRLECGIVGFTNQKKVVVIEDLPDRKAVREFLLSLSSDRVDEIKIIIWDSEGSIKEDPKTRSLGKKWQDFVTSFKNIEGAIIINCGAAFTEKEGSSCIAFIQTCFKKHGKEIGNAAAQVLMDIVGNDRGFLKSDIDKMSLIAPSVVKTDFIVQHAFPMTQEAILYKLSNVLDEGNYEEAVAMVERFVESGTNENVLAEILVKKARWHLAAASLWLKGYRWSDIGEQLFTMGKFPSAIWHSRELTPAKKKSDSERFKEDGAPLLYMTKNLGLPLRCFRTKDEKKRRAEVIPFAFMAETMVGFLRKKVVGSLPDHLETKQLLVKRCMEVYLFCHEKLVDIRGGKNPMQEIQEIVRAITNPDLERFREEIKKA